MKQRLKSLSELPEEHMQGGWCWEAEDKEACKKGYEALCDLERISNVIETRSELINGYHMVRVIDLLEGK